MVLISGDKNRKYSPPNLTVKRSFTIRNVGELPIFVHNFYINGLKCEGYGFSVLNCASFELPINGTRKIDVAFTPDFTLMKVQRTLTISTSLGIEVNYTLITTLPPFFLQSCSSVLSRPTWEPLLYYSAVSFMMFLLFCVLAAAFFESDRILKCALMTLARDRTTVPLDLRQIGNNVLKEFNQNSIKKIDCATDNTEKSKQKDSLSNSYCNVVPIVHEKQLTNTQKDEKSELYKRSEEPLDIVKEKELHSAPNNIIPLNNLSKSKKKLSKKTSNSTDMGAAEPGQESSNKKKDKNFTNSTWCSVFTRGNSCSTEKMKLKTSSAENEHIKQIRNDIENKKEDKKVNKIKKQVNKEASKEEEETSSTMTDSSNDAEKENSESVSGLKNDKSKKFANKERKSNILECKENHYEGDWDEDGLEKGKKSVVTKNSWKVNTKSPKFGNVPDSSINLWKPSGSEGQKNIDFAKHKTKTMRERKEKNLNRRRFGEKVTIPKG